jgi:hypothetical protein
MWIFDEKSIKALRFRLFLICAAWLTRYLYVHFVNDTVLSDIEIIWWMGAAVYYGLSIEIAEVREKLEAHEEQALLHQQSSVLSK